MTVINTNTASLVNQAALNQNTTGLQKVMEELSTGKRINSAADDAAGLAISARLTSAVRGLNQAVRNANDGISLLKTADGAMSTVTDILQRMRELTVQAQNATYSAADKTSMSTEFSQLRNEINRIAQTTQWSGFNILDGSVSSGKFSFYIGSSTNSNNTVTITIANIGTSGLSASSVKAVALDSLGSTAAASTALTDVNTAIQSINNVRSKLGAFINRFEFTVDNLTNISTNTSASLSRIQDTDYSQATSELARRQVIQQAATAMLAQANQAPQTVLQLLKQ
jgi:flagellin